MGRSPQVLSLSCWTAREGGERHCLQLCSHGWAHQAPGDILDPCLREDPGQQQQIPEPKDLIKGCGRQGRVGVRIIGMCYIHLWYCQWTNVINKCILKVLLERERLNKEAIVKNGALQGERSSRRDSWERGNPTGLLVQGLFLGLVADTEQRLRSCSLRFKALTVSHIERMEDPHIMCTCPGPNRGDSHTLRLHRARSARGMVRLWRLCSTPAWLACMLLLWPWRGCSP